MKQYWATNTEEKYVYVWAESFSEAQKIKGIKAVHGLAPGKSKDLFTPEIGASHYATINGSLVVVSFSPFPTFGYWPATHGSQTPASEQRHEFKTPLAAQEFFDSLS